MIVKGGLVSWEWPNVITTPEAYKAEESAEHMHEATRKSPSRQLIRSDTHTLKSAEPPKLVLLCLQQLERSEMDSLVSRAAIAPVFILFNIMKTKTIKCILSILKGG